jgi:hypothetical protein
MMLSMEENLFIYLSLCRQYWKIICGLRMTLTVVFSEIPDHPAIIIATIGLAAITTSKWEVLAYI